MSSGDEQLTIPGTKVEQTLFGLLKAVCVPLHTIPRTKVEQTLFDLMKVSNVPLQSDNTYTCLWKDESHMRQWMDRVQTSEAVRIITVPREAIPIFDHNNTDSCVVVAGFGLKDDLSDVREVCSIVVPITREPSRQTKCQKGSYCNNIKEKKLLPHVNCSWCKGVFCSACVMHGPCDFMRTPVCWTCYYDFCG